MLHKESSSSKFLTLFKNKKNFEHNESNLDENDLLKSIWLKKLQESDTSKIASKTDLLQKRYNSFINTNHFETGMLVSWKAGLRNQSGLRYNQLGIVLEKLTIPIFDTTNVRRASDFKEPFDIIIAFLDEDNNFTTFFANSRRLQPCSE